MSLPAQALYLQLGMEADDDGFVNNAVSIARSIGAGPEHIEEIIPGSRARCKADVGGYTPEHPAIVDGIYSLCRVERQFAFGKLRDRKTCLSVGPEDDGHLAVGDAFLVTLLYGPDHKINLFCVSPEFFVDRKAGSAVPSALRDKLFGEAASVHRNEP